MQKGNSMKEYIHHPETVPLEAKEVNQCFCKTCHNDETNGLSFTSESKFEKDSVINVRIEIEGELFNAYGKVTESISLKDGSYEIFVDFSDRIDPFKIKMIQQICQIVDYSTRKDIKQNVAADKWIKENAKVFQEGNYNKKKMKMQ